MPCSACVLRVYVTELILLDRNDLSGSLEAVCAMGTLKLAAADCSEVTCECCDPCCNDGEECHDYGLIEGMDWDSGYDRGYFNFNVTIQRNNGGN